MTVLFINIGRVPFPKAMCADIRITKCIAYSFKMFLYSAYGDREHALIGRNVMFSTISAEEVIHSIGNGKRSLFPGLFLNNVESVSVSIPNDIIQFQLEDIANAHSKICFCGKNSRYAGIGAERAVPGADCANESSVLIGSQSFHADIFLSDSDFVYCAFASLDSAVCI